MTFKPVRSIAEAQKFLFIDLPNSPREVFRGEDGFTRAADLLERLDNPQDSFRSIHIAGTSGKGSTAYITAELLQSAGKKVGLHVSPHVYDLRERMQINGNFIDEEELCEHINTLIPVVNSMSDSKYGRPGYPEVTCALALMVFRAHKVNYAVIETGLGGRYDVTNHITRTDKVAIINQIGLDHTAILGNTISAIASQKAGIITPQTHAIALWQSEDARKEFEVQAESVDAELEFLDPAKILDITSLKPAETRFDLHLDDWDWTNVSLSLTGKHQVTNATLALRALQYLAKRDGWVVSQADTRKSLSNIRMPGRFEIHHKNGKTVILDGAHNVQKLASLTETLANVYPGRKFTFVVALTDTKKSLDCLRHILPLAEHIIVTWFELDKIPQLHYGIPPSKLASQLDNLGYKSYTVEENARKAYELAMRMGGDIVVTGSFYLIASLERFTSKNLVGKA